MTTRRHALITVVLLAAQPCARAGGFQLVAPREAEAEREHVSTLRQRRDRALAQGRALPDDGIDPDAPPLVLRSMYPSIRIVSPAVTASDALKAPLRIELAFVAAPGTRIVPESFRALYGLLKIDVTERLRSYAQVSERGVVAEQAMLPAGAHRLYLQVADDQGRVFERELRFRVEV